MSKFTTPSCCSDEELFNADSPNLIASTPTVDDWPVKRFITKGVCCGSIFDSSSSSDDDDSGVFSQASRKRKKDLRAVGRSSQHLELQENTVTKTGELTVSARIVVDDEECFLDGNQQKAINVIVDNFKRSKKDKASVKRKQNVLKAISELLDGEQTPANDDIVTVDLDTDSIVEVPAGQLVPVEPQAGGANVEIAGRIPNIDDELKNYQFNSDSVLLEQARLELMCPHFARVSKGLRGLAPIESVSEEDFLVLRAWEVPGVLFDFGHHLTLKEASRLLAEEEQRENILGITAFRYSLRQVNFFLEGKFSSSDVPGGHSSAFVLDRRSVELGEDIYKFYSWIDPGIRSLGPMELDQFLDHSNLSFFKSNVAPWPMTLFPKDPHDVKYLSVCRDGYEFVCRTMASRQRDLKFFTNSSEIFSCAICGDLISTPYHTYVNCYKFFKNAPFVLIMKWTKTFLRACYLHFKCEGVSLPGRDCHSDASIGDQGSGWLGRGSSRGRGGRGSSWRRGSPSASLFRPK